MHLQGRENYDKMTISHLRRHPEYLSTFQGTKNIYLGMYFILSKNVNHFIQNKGLLDLK